MPGIAIKMKVFVPLFLFGDGLQEILHNHAEKIQEVK